MFVVKITKNKQLLDVKHYKVFQNAIADIGSKNIFENIEEELVETLGNPEIRSFSYSEITGISDDFEFRYQNGVNVYLGELSFVDEIPK